MLRVLAFLAAVPFFLMALAAGQEPVKPPLNPRIITATKQVTMFTALEKQMLDAVQKKDQAKLNVMLTEEATIHLPDADPLPGDEWVQSVMSQDFTLKSFAIRQMDVSDLGTAAVVAYDRIQDSMLKGKQIGGEFYVVDLWKKDGDNWKLADRYVSKVGTTPVLPSAPVHPTGKQ
ncbi:MAG TPA: nuclear transport factor 2 family protein [Candidatus Angelobacter sp.]|nr:nuclear transport factor 2 family protein [Candidatus Angelobacter sp.]